MKFNATYTFIGGGLAFLLASACCWLPVILISLGGAAGLVSLSNDLQAYSGLFISLGIVLAGMGTYQFYNQRSRKKIADVKLSSTITCPECGFKKDEVMPTNACQYFYECTQCKSVLKPLKGDCCVYCSYGTMVCPPMQQDEACC